MNILVRSGAHFAIYLRRRTPQQQESANHRAATVQYGTIIEEGIVAIIFCRKRNETNNNNKHVQLTSINASTHRSRSIVESTSIQPQTTTQSFYMI